MADVGSLFLGHLGRITLVRRQPENPALAEDLTHVSDARTRLPKHWAGFGQKGDDPSTARREGEAAPR